MTVRATRPSVRRRSLVVGVCASVLAATASLTSGGGATAGPPAPAAAHAGPHSGQHASAPARTARVMTRNLFLGADLTPVIAALAGGDPATIVTEATRTWAAVQATRPEERMAAIADEIVATRADVVGLQEVTRWTTAPYDPATGTTGTETVAYDFLQLLLDALAARGADYREVTGATADNFVSPPIPVLAGQSVPTQAVRLADRDVIIARDGVRLRHARTGTYKNVLGFPVNGTIVPVTRGWGSVDVRVRRAHLRLVNSHLEAFGLPGTDAEALRVKQVRELLAAQRALAARVGELPTVYVGDYNSKAPDARAYSRLLAGVGRDAWTSQHRHGRGYTCCFGTTLTDPTDRLTSRIDLVLTTPDVRARRATVIGEEVADRTPSGLWPSDHAGVWARLVVPARRR